MAQFARVQKISSTQGGFLVELHDGAGFGTQVAGLGDLDGDGVPDVSIGAPGGMYPGASVLGSVWILFLNHDGTVKRQVELPPAEIGTEDEYDLSRGFGIGLTAIGDQDSDGTTDLAVSSAKWFYFQLLNRDGSPKPHPGVNYGSKNESHRFAVVSSADSLIAIAPGSLDSPGYDKSVEIWRWTLSEGTMLSHFAESPGGSVTEWSGFGAALSAINLVGLPTLVVGAPFAVTNDYAFGAVALLPVEMIYRGADLNLVSRGRIRVDPTGSSISGASRADQFGAAVASAGDLNEDGQDDLLVGAPHHDGGGLGRGAVWTMMLNPDGTVKWYDKVSSDTRDELAMIQDQSYFGSAISALGDMNGDGVVDIAVGAPGDDDGGRDRGAVYILMDLDATRPGIELLSSPTNPVPIGVELIVTAKVATVRGTPSVNLVFARGGDTEELSARMNEVSPGVYSGKVPAFLVTERGVEHYVSASSPVGAVSVLPETGFVSTRVVVANGLDFSAPGGGQTNGYRLVSVPLQLDRPSASAVFEDDLGPYDPNRWRFFGADTRGNPIEFGQDSLLMEPGTAFWLLTKDRPTTVNTGPGVSIRTDIPFDLPLHKGWNYVADPYTFPVPVSRLRLSSGDDLEVLTYDGGWTPVEQIEPFKGYIIYSNRAQESLAVDPDLRGTQARGNTAVGNHESSASAAEWSIWISARKGDARDMKNSLGMSSAASDGWDRLDKVEPPTVGDFISVYFDHSEWGLDATSFRSDVRALDSGQWTMDSEQWTVSIAAGSSGAVELSFEGVDSVPVNLDVWLHDPLTGARQDLRANPRFRVVVPGQAKPWYATESATSQRTLEVHVGPHKEGVEERELPNSNPSTLAIQNSELSTFPNPFSRATTVTYRLAGTTEVSLGVFDALGRLVVQLQTSTLEGPGNHAVVWDAHSNNSSSVAPGVYVIQLRAGSISASKLITLSE